MSARPAITLRYRLDVAARVVAAMAGGYALAVLVAIAGSWTLPMSRIDAAAAATIAALVSMPVTAIGCFWARTAGRAWGGLLIAALVLGGAALAGGWRP